MTKTCYKCNKTKNLSDFYKKKANTTDGHSGRCKKCDNAMKNDWVKRNPEKRKAYEKKRNRYYPDRRGYRGDAKKEADLARARKYSKELAPQYIRCLIRVSSTNLIAKDISDEFVEAYKLHIELKRALRKLK